MEWMYYIAVSILVLVLPGMFVVNEQKTQTKQTPETVGITDNLPIISHLYLQL